MKKVCAYTAAIFVVLLLIKPGIGDSILDNIYAARLSQKNPTFSKAEILEYLQTDGISFDLRNRRIENFIIDSNLENPMLFYLAGFIGDGCSSNDEKCFQKLAEKLNSEIPEITWDSRKMK